MPEGPVVQTVIPWPLRGIDRQMPTALEPVLTCPDARNVRNLSPATKRLGGGRRPGLVKALAGQLAGTSSRRATWMQAVRRIPQTVAPSTSGTPTAVLDDLSGYTSVGSTASLGTSNLAGNYLSFARTPSTGLALSDATWWAKYYDTTNGHALILQVDASVDRLLLVNADTTNDITVKVAGYPGAQDQISGTPAYGTMNGVGAFVRGESGHEVACRRCFAAYLEWTGQTNTVRLVIDQMSESGTARVSTSAKTFTLYGTATLSRDCNIRLRATDYQIVASVDWPSGAPGGVSDTLTLDNNTTYNTNKGAGVIVRAGAANGSGNALLKWVDSLSYNRVAPYPFGPYYDTGAGRTAELFSPAVAAVGGNAFVLPAGFSSSGTLITATPSPVNGPLNYAAVQDWPTVNTTNDYIDSTASFGAALATRKQVISWNGAYPSGTDRVLEFNCRNVASASDEINPCFLVASDHSTMLRLELVRNYTTNVTSHKQDYFSTISIYAIWNNSGTITRTLIKSFTYSGSAVPPTFYTGKAIRVTHSGSGTGATLTMTCEGRTIWTYNYGNDSTWTGTITSKPAGSRVGIDVGTVGASNALGFGWRLLDTNTPAFTVVNPGTDVVAITGESIQVCQALPTAGSSWTTLSGTTLTGTAPEAAIINGQVYAVDGSNSKNIDPVKQTINDWRNVTGTSLDRCKLATVWRGRVVIARQESSPAAWYMAAVNAPTDFTFGGTLATRAVAGTGPEVGQPGDEITALIPFTDDYFIFGCKNSMWVLQGDPARSGSTLTIMNNSVGVVGARAYCFDESGNMYFLSPGGLCRIARGSLTVEVLGDGRLPSILDEINTDTTLVQMAFDRVRRLVHVFITPSDNSAGLHVVYDRFIESEGVGGALWLDVYPAGMQPWAVTTLAGGATDDRRILLAGNDGYVRRFSESALDDDGTVIDAYIRFKPLDAGGGSTRSMVCKLDADCTATTGAFSWYWDTANSPEDVQANALYGGAASGTWGIRAGAQPTVGIRRAGLAHQLTIRQNAAAVGFGLERVIATIESRGKRRVP